MGLEEQLAQLTAEVKSLRAQVQTLTSGPGAALVAPGPTEPSRLSRRSFLPFAAAAAAVAATGAISLRDAPSAAAATGPNQQTLNGLTIAPTDPCAADPNDGCSYTAGSIRMGDAASASLTGVPFNPILIIEGNGGHFDAGQDGVSVTTVRSTAMKLASEGIGLDVAVGFGEDEQYPAQAIVARQTAATGVGDVVEISNAGLGRGLIATLTNAKNTMGAVTGVSKGTGAGVWGTAASGDAVVGKSSKGRGGRFSGGAANLRLVPSTAHTHPKAGSAGDLFVDASHRLWFCKKSSTHVATWVQLG